MLLHSLSISSWCSNHMCKAQSQMLIGATRRHNHHSCLFPEVGKKKLVCGTQWSFVAMKVSPTDMMLFLKKGSHVRQPMQHPHANHTPNNAMMAVTAPLKKRAKNGNAMTIAHKISHAQNSMDEKNVTFLRHVFAFCSKKNSDQTLCILDTFPQNKQHPKESQKECVQRILQ